MRRFVAALMLFGVACGVVGCDRLTTPDSDDMAQYEQRIGALPGAVQQELRKWAANRFTAGYLRGLSHNFGGVKIGTIDCMNGGKVDVFVRDMLHCLDTNQNLSYKECLEEILGDVQDGKPGEGGLCDWRMPFTPGYDPEHLPDECDPDKASLRSILEALIVAPGPPVGLDAAALAALLQELGPALCVLPLDQGGPVEWTCPDSPLYPGNSSSATGGDR